MEQETAAESCPAPEHGHNHDEHGSEHHGHSHGAASEKSLLISIFLNAGITIAEIIGGILSGSLALLSDAFHNLSDVASLIISYIALLIGRRSKSATKTYGYKRAEILAALANVVALFFVCVYIIFEAVKRLRNPEPINSGLMMIIAVIGLIGNGVSVLILFRSSKDNLNIKSAFLHLIGDTISSIGVILVAILLHFKPWYFMDAVISVLISLYIIKESLSIFLESINILMQSAPRELNKEKIIQAILSIKDIKVKDIHHIHMWDITPGKTVFDAHVVIDKNDLQDADNIIKKINHVLIDDFHISHSTIQLESGTINKCVTCNL